MPGTIYIGGVSYSGKTQLRLLLSNHPGIIITRRTYLWKKYFRKFGDLSRPENLEKCLKTVLASKHIQALAPDADRIRKEFSAGAASYSRLFSLIHRHYAESLGKSHWGVQVGGVEKDAALLFAHEPEARIIHVVRNPLDRIAESLVSASRKKLSLGLEANSWRHSARLAQTNAGQFPGRYLIVKWEDLLAEPEQTLENICGFLGVAHDPAIFSLDEPESLGLSFCKESDTRKIKFEKLDRTTPAVLTQADQGFVLTYLKSEMACFGYSHSAGEGRGSLGKDYPLYLLGTMIAKPLKVYQKINQFLPL